MNFRIHSRYLCSNITQGYFKYSSHIEELKELQLFKPKKMPVKHSKQWFGEYYEYETGTVQEHQRTILEFCIEMTR